MSRHDPFVRRALLLAALGLVPGCGMILDLDPPDDAGAPAGMDAGAGDGGAAMDAARPDAGPPRECALDEDCDDDLFCNGLEHCVLGRCSAGTPVECDDGVDCTEDRCAEDDKACEHRPDDGRCLAPGLACLSGVCDAAIGCVVARDDAECDDGNDCTLDGCTVDGCVHRPADALCETDEFCDPSAGCERIPDCTTAADCPALQCHGPPECIAGTCEYTPVPLDPACTHPDPCVPAFCEEGTCRIGAPRTCASALDPTTCTVEQCARSEAGDSVACVPVPRTGSCLPTMPCHNALCTSGTCVETNACPPPSDACHVPICTGGGCGEVPLACGPNATCLSSSAGAACACNPGFTQCAAGELGCNCPVVPDAGASDANVVGSDGGPAPTDAAAATCRIGLVDCNGDGTCECDTLLSRCDPDARRCRCLLTCGLTRECCRDDLLDVGYCAPRGTCPP